jgi:hypothetical protein
LDSVVSRIRKIFHVVFPIFPRIRNAAPQYRIFFETAHRALLMLCWALVAAVCHCILFVSWLCAPIRLRTAAFLILPAKHKALLSAEKLLASPKRRKFPFVLCFCFLWRADPHRKRSGRSRIVFTVGALNQETRKCSDLWP